MSKGEPRVLRVLFPLLPSAVLGPNYHGHWSVRAREAREHRELAALLTGVSMGRAGLSGLPWEHATVAYTWFGRRPWPDRDNALARLKPVLDGVVDAGLLRDDGPDTVRSLSVEYYRRGRGQHGEVVVKVQWIDEATPGTPTLPVEQW